MMYHESKVETNATSEADDYHTDMQRNRYVDIVEASIRSNNNTLGETGLSKTFWNDITKTLTVTSCHHVHNTELTMHRPPQQHTIMNVVLSQSVRPRTIEA